MRVYTTIRPRYQRLAEDAIRDTMTEPTDPAAALISISPRTGAIRAMAAVIPNRPKNQFNLVSQARRQPGSTFKTFVLAAAVEMGINPDSTYYVSAPFTYKQHPVGSCEDETWWCVHTYDNSYSGWSSIRSATIRSDNSVYAQLTLDVSPEKVAQVARKMGIVRSTLLPRARDRPRLGRGLAARAGVRLRDDRSGRDLRRADGDQARRARERQGGPARGVGSTDQASRHLRGHRRRSSPGSSSRTCSRGPGRAPRSAALRRARPAPTRSTRTRGSPGTRPTSRRRSGSATRRPRSRWRTSTGSPSAAGASRRRSGACSWSPRSRAPSRRRSPSRPTGRSGSRSRGASTRSTTTRTTRRRRRTTRGRGRACRRGR